jgi:type IV pilus assembly protein PilE
MKRAASGFTLIEVMIAVAVVGILTAIAVPSYTNYVLRARLTEAFSALSATQPNAEQFWANNRTYVAAGTATFPLPANTTNFSYSLSNASSSAYTVTATGAGSVSDFVFTIDQNGARATTGAPSGWTTNANCWIDRKPSQCTQ